MLFSVALCSSAWDTLGPDSVREVVAKALNLVSVVTLPFLPISVTHDINRAYRMWSLSSQAASNRATIAIVLFNSNTTSIVDVLFYSAGGLRGT